MKKSDVFNLKIIGYYQILGGLVGIFFVTLLILDFHKVNVFNILISLIFLLLFSYSIFCGYFILVDKIQKGLDHSLINQVLQIINFSITGYAYKYVSGVLLSFGIDHTNEFLLDFNASISQAQILINTHSEIIKIGFNIVAFIMTLYLQKLRKSYSVSNL